MKIYFRDIFDFWKVLKKVFFYNNLRFLARKSLLLKSTILGLKALEIYFKKKKIKNFLALKSSKNIFQKFSLKCFILIPDFC